MTRLLWREPMFNPGLCGRDSVQAGLRHDFVTVVLQPPVSFIIVRADTVYLSVEAV